MPDEKKLTGCCSTVAYWDPVVLIRSHPFPAKTTFARAPACSKCGKIVGDYKVLYGAPSAVTRKMDGLAWRTMIDERMKRPGMPFNFVEKDGRYWPEGMTGERRAQMEIDDEVPF